MKKKDIKILIVDDREDNLLSIEVVLEQDGYQLVKANSGRDALKILLKDDDFSLILMDVKMPGLDGYETAELISQRDKFRNIPIIFITAHHYEEKSVYRGYKAGAVDYIYKPYTPELLRSKVAVFSELFRKNQQLLMQEQKLKATNANLVEEIKKQKEADDEIKRLNDEMVQYIEKLKASNEELERFAFIASHDLQEPLRKIMMWSGLLNFKYNEAIEPQAKDYIVRMQNTASRMQDMIKDILSFSKITVDDQTRTVSNLNEIVDSALNNLELKISERNARIEVDKLPKVNVVPQLISRVFQNLVSNSLKFCKEGTEPCVIIKEEHNEAGEINGRKFYHISISDNGIGFDEKYSGKIFEMFKRLHTRDEYEGSGIGLALCKKIIEQHNGQIKVKSIPNQGTTFIISLPVEEIESIEKKVLKNRETVLK